MYNYSQDYLAHYGVKGMKWGVRHDPELVGRRISRNERYRQKLLARSASKIETNRRKTLKYRNQYEDLKRGGVNSETWQKHVDSETRKNIAKDFSKAVGAERTRYNSQDMEHYKLDIKYKVKNGEKVTRDLLSTNSKLANMKIDASTTKRDIRKAYRQNSANTISNKIIDKKHIGSQAGSLAGAAAGLAVGRYLSKAISSNPKFKDNQLAGQVIETMVTSGSVYAGQMLGRYGGQSVSKLMRK